MSIKKLWVVATIVATLLTLYSGGKDIITDLNRNKNITCSIVVERVTKHAVVITDNSTETITTEKESLEVNGDC